MATFLQGQTFGSTEQVTNTKLHNLVANASISNILASEFAANILYSLVSGSGKIPRQNMINYGSVATNASLIDISTFSVLPLFYSTYGSLATFINARVGQEFSLIAQQASFPVISDAGAFKLSAAWIPAKQYDNIKLVWDGSAFVEVGRVTT